ncbi:MAG: bifunctional alpha/beta hydrolase/OsmC family protein [Paracoccaceae bacterium]|nr:bifunctional alpha/beta hydrolase/OsmC family protein [Paracoccaceae bacterium]
MPQERLTFAGHSGDQLSARLDLPSASPRATALFAHCFTCSKDIPAARRISQKLAALGLAVLRFDFTGLGHSGGEFANTGFSTNVQDLVLAAKSLEDRIDGPSLLIGHSLGGAAVLKAAAEIPSAKAVVTIGAPSDPEHVLHNFGESLENIRATGEAEVSLAGRTFTVRKSFVDDVSTTKLIDSIGKLRRALLVLHSPIDQTVGIENAAAIFSAARHPKSFVTLDSADHLVSRREDAEYAAEVIAAWVARYLDLPVQETSASVPEGAVSSSEVEPAGFLQQVLASPQHHLWADEPAKLGGSGQGMTPYQLLSAGLAACTSMTVRMYARHKNWPLEHVRVEVSHDKIHADDCLACKTPVAGNRIDRFRRSLHLTGPLSAEQRRRLMEIADRCPVHRTLSGSVHVQTELTAGDPNDA